MAKHSLRVVVNDPAGTVRQLKEKGVRVLHRFGKTLVIEDQAAPDLVAEVSRLTSAMQSSPLAAVPAKVSDEDIPLLAFRLRQSENFRRAKTKRATEGDDWDEIMARL